MDAPKNMTRRQRESLYRVYMEFFDVGERKRRWHFEDDIPWDKLKGAVHDETTAMCLETFCGVEMYVPDYTANGFLLNREVFGHAWFQACWGYEESKHALVYREYLTRSGLRTQDEIYAFERMILSKEWKLPYQTRRQMTCYGAIQEATTYLIYASQKDKYEALGNEVLHTIFSFVSRDESAHTGFYRKTLRLEFENDYEGTLNDLALVASTFQMPGVGIYEDYDRRVAIPGVGISPQDFLKMALFPTLRSLGISRRDVVSAMRRQSTNKSAQANTDFILEAEAREHERRMTHRAGPV